MFNQESYNLWKQRICEQRISGMTIPEWCRINELSQMHTITVVFYQHDDILLKMDNLKNVKAEDFNSEDDIYIVDKSISWTYVHTHEERCGPYFCKIDNK